MRKPALALLTICILSVLQCSSHEVVRDRWIGELRFQLDDTSYAWGSVLVRTWTAGLPEGERGIAIAAMENVRNMIEFRADGPTNVSWSECVFSCKLTLERQEYTADEVWLEFTVESEEALLASFTSFQVSQQSGANPKTLKNGALDITAP